MVENKKLDLKWVSDRIGEEYKNWSCGDVITIEAQTGTGKTHFILNKLFVEEVLHKDNELLYICNRLYLKREVKIQAARIQGIKIDEEDFEELDKRKTIGKITVTSYHEIQQQILNEEYFGMSNLKEYYNNYRYVVLDEVHYFKQDSFNGQTTFFFNDFIKKYNPFATTIYITATMDYVGESLVQYYTSLNKEIKQYSTGIDYSYIKPFYFEEFSNIIKLIKNDKTDDKWLIFVSNSDDARKVLNEVVNSKFICAKDCECHNLMDEETLKEVITLNKFNSKVLVSTKALDNGVNIKDDLLKHIVIIAWDRVDFIQMLGRKRIDINNAQEVNLYIPKKKKLSFTTILERKYKPRNEAVKLYNKDYTEFCRKYDKAIKDLAKFSDLFYRGTDKEWKVNSIGYEMLKRQIEFAEEMVERLEVNENAFLKEQLSWIQLQEHFNSENLVENLIQSENCESVQEYLDNLYKNKIKLFDREKQQLKNFISKDFDDMMKKLQGRHKDRKAGKKVLNKLFKVCDIPYLIKSDDTTRKTINGKKVSYWVIEKKSNLVS